MTVEDAQSWLKPHTYFPSPARPSHPVLSRPVPSRPVPSGKSRRTCQPWLSSNFSKITGEKRGPRLP